MSSSSSVGVGRQAIVCITTSPGCEPRYARGVNEEVLIRVSSDCDVSGAALLHAFRERTNLCSEYVDLHFDPRECEGSVAVIESPGAAVAAAAAVGQYTHLLLRTRLRFSAGAVVSFLATVRAPASAAAEAALQPPPPDPPPDPPPHDGGGGSPSSLQRAAVTRALREAVCDAFGASVDDSRISLGAPLPLWARDIREPLRSRLRLHRLISGVRPEDFYAEVDDSKRITIRPAEGAEVAKGMSFFAVLSFDPGVIAAAHSFMRPSLRNLGCCVRTLDELPPGTDLVFDSVKLSSTASDDAHIIVHASLVPSARVRLIAIAAALEKLPARKCDIAGHADADSDRESGGSGGGGDTCSVRADDFEEPDKAQAEGEGDDARAGSGLGGSPYGVPGPSPGPTREAAPPTGGSPEIVVHTA